MANKYYFGEADSSSYQRIVEVAIFRMEDDEQIGLVDLLYDFDKINERDEFKIEKAEWSGDITIEMAEEALEELLKRAGDEFQEFIERCHDYNHDDEDELSWFV